MNLKIFKTGLSDLVYARNPSVKVKQISTHSHEWYNGHHHKDFVSIKGKSSFKFPKIEDGPGIINCIWFTFTPLNFIEFIKFSKISGLQSIMLKIYFDDEEEPRVNTPIGDYFGAGWGKYKKDSARSLYVGMTSGGYYSHFPMPFKKSAQIVIENTSKRTCNAFYGQISYQTIPDFTDEMLYFNARYRQEDMKANEDKPYTILEDSNGPGHYLGVMLSQQQKKLHWLPIELPSIKKIKFYLPTNLAFLEGNVKVYIDGEEENSYESTGNEDYFMGAWYYNKGEFSHLYHGLVYKKGKRITSYRFHPETIPYQKSIKVTVNVGEFNEVAAFYKSVTYWYSKT
ncbi:MAG: glycoside hydrolase family 172 protein [Candidatus Helarchaeota archaeon]